MNENKQSHLNKVILIQQKFIEQTQLSDSKALSIYANWTFVTRFKQIQSNIVYTSNHPQSQFNEYNYVNANLDTRLIVGSLVLKL